MTMFDINTTFPEAQALIRILVFVVILVMMAVGIDLVFGLYKAGVRGEVRSSWGLKRTSVKILLYVGVILVMGFVDCLIHICRFYQMFGWHDIVGIPVLACLIGIFFLCVEVKSMFESADEKTRTEITRGAQMVKEITENQQTMKKLTELLEIMAKGVKTT